ncbi:LysR family transcriptional regulator [Vibrio sp. SS-MA-C1-2]|uniref:LysR family transcriptional regulator n=1 Tax=Vibrio sp. SS-MA-C1-2 TaxID=2908646 RepID=UPI001F4088FF|nr:LysR family transcriptional regulator [Vibrio sp. SS-MA-C1-2]UJF19895.1 LysR family transcriptional regulator [Vibrio sp. SS-MA-C1-2]
MKNPLDDYYVFCQVVKFGSMKKVGELLDLPISTVSRRIGALEEHLDVKLFIRTKNKIIPTNEGQKYYQRVVEQCDSFYQSIQTINDELGEVTGKVVLTVPKYFYAQYLSDTFLELLRQYPKLSLEIYSPTTSSSINEGVDIAIVMGNLPSSNLIAKRLTDVNVLFIAAPHLHQQYQDKKIDSLEELPYVTTWAHPEFTFYDQKSNKQIKIKPHLKLSLMDLHLAYDAVKKGAGYGLFPELLCQDDLGDSVINVFPDLNMSQMKISIMYRNRDLQSQAQKVVIKAINDIFI